MQEDNKVSKLEVGDYVISLDRTMYDDDKWFHSPVWTVVAVQKAGYYVIQNSIPTLGNIQQRCIVKDLQKITKETHPELFI